MADNRVLFSYEFASGKKMRLITDEETLLVLPILEELIAIKKRELDLPNTEE